MEKVIITGHSSGLGQALAEYYLQQHYPVLGLSRRLLPSQPKLTQYSVDLAMPQAVDDFLARNYLADFIIESNSIILINNAATVEPNTLAGRATSYHITQAIQLNTTTPLILTNQLIQMRKADCHLKIVHISSGAGRKAYSGWCVYGASKAALDHHAKVIAAEQQPNIRIVSLAPGIINTTMQASIRQAKPADFPLVADFQALKESGKLSPPHDIAIAIAGVIAAPQFGQQTIMDIRDYLN